MMIPIRWDGSVIHLCTLADGLQMYAEVFERGAHMLKAALATLGIAEYNRAGDPSPVVLNTLPWPRAEIARMPETGHSDAVSKYAVLRSEGGLGRVQLLSDDSPVSVASLKELAGGVFELSNQEYKVVIDQGHITSLFDRRADREVIPKGKRANQLVIFDDKPLYWQAWDVEVYHLECRQELPSVITEVSERGPHRVSVVVKTKISEASWVKSTISLAASIDGYPSYIEIESEVEWRETMKFLKVEFPVDIRNTEAAYEVQYGIVRRPTHYNTRLVPLSSYLSVSKQTLC